MEEGGDREPAPAEDRAENRAEDRAEDRGEDDRERRDDRGRDRGDDRDREERRDDRGRDRGDDEGKVSLIVRNLPYHARKTDIFERFEEFGKIKDVYVPLDHYTRYHS